MADVLKLIQCTNLGGMEQVSMGLMERLQSRGHSFRIVSPRPFGPGEERLRAVDPYSRSFPYLGKFGWRSQSEFEAHVLHLADGCGAAWVTGTDVACLRALRAVDGPKLMGHHYHHFERRRDPARWWLFYTALCRQLDCITYPTDFTRNEALRIAPWLRKRAVVVRNPVEVVYQDEAERLKRQQAARARLRLPADAFIVGNAGWLIRRKRFDVFIDTAAQLLQKPSIRPYFVICGSGPEEQALREQALRLGIADSILFAGFQQDIGTWYDAMDTLLFNSDFDALGMSPCEAAARGAVVVASVNYGGLGEFIQDGQNGYLMRDHDPVLLAERLDAIRRSTTLAGSLRMAAAETLREQFSPKAATDFHDSFFS